MNKAEIDLPPFHKLSTTLRTVTERLARDLAQPSSSPPRWSELEWGIAQSVAAMQGISGLLANNSRWSGPIVWQEFLAEQLEQSILRDELIDDLLQRIDLETREAGITCVALKGSALRKLGLYRPGERPMGDIDLLVSGDEIASISAIVRDLDYVQAYTTQRHAVYEPRSKAPDWIFGEHIDNPLKLEIHSSVAELLPIRSVDITNYLKPTKTGPGLNTYKHQAGLMLHLLLHAAGNMRAHALRQIQLNDIAALAPKLSAEDWRTLFELPESKQRLWWAFPPLALAARYYPKQIPADVLVEARSECPRALRFATARQSLTDVSWSNLRIHAFPGIAWSRTPLDALRFIRSRLLPNHRALTELNTGIKNQPWFLDTPWYGISHSQRILRWLFFRPPRVQTIVSVRAALERTNIALE